MSRITINYLERRVARLNKLLGYKVEKGSKHIELLAQGAYDGHSNYSLMLVSAEGYYKDISPVCTGKELDHFIGGMMEMQDILSSVESV